MGLRWVLVSAAAIVAGAAWCPQAGAIVGGSDISSISAAPYQVAVVRHGYTPYSGLWCGGSVRDSRHIITAAHCVFDNQLGAAGQPVAPGAIDVYAGRRDLTDSRLVRQPVASVSLDEGYDPATFASDAAVLTLSAPLVSPQPGLIEPIQLVDDESWAAAIPPDPAVSPEKATVTGWGETLSNNPNSYPHILQTAQVPIVRDVPCAPAYSGFDAPLMTCAGDGVRDSCFGDSGGPLVVPDANTPGDVRLLGIVSFGPAAGCAIDGSPGVYTEVHAADIAAYLQADPTPAPRTDSAPSLVGTVAVGSTVTCDPGTWQGSPDFAYRFVVPTADGDVARTAQSSQSSYTIQAGDAGGQLRCDVKGTNAGGLALASSAPVTVPVPSGPPQIQPQPPPVQNQQDSAAPVARVTRTRCTVTRCTLTVTVSDAGFSAGIKSLQASVRSTYRSTCRRNGRKVACTKQRTGKPSVKALSARRFQVVASKLPVGKQLFILVAIDKAGHRQPQPTRKTVTTKRR